MKRRTRKLCAVVAVCVLLAPADGSLQAQQRADQIGASNSQIAGAIAGIAAGGALIGIGVYFAVKHNHSVTGCAHSTADGMTLTTESDKQTYVLMGEVTAIKPGNRVRVSGKKSKEKSAGNAQFLVEKVSQDFGACGISVPSH